MATYKIAEAITGHNEGGFANDSEDYGGMTVDGITYRDWPNWDGWIKVKQLITKYGISNVKAIDSDLKKDMIFQQKKSDFYKRYYWDVNSLDAFKSQPIANELFDTGVNMGVGTAAKFLQEALNLCNKKERLYPNISVDGKIGQKTLSTLDKAPQQAVLNTLNLLQGEKYLNIMRANESQEKFWQSWLSRVFINGKWN